MQVDIGCAESCIFGGNKSIVPRVFVKTACDIVKFIEKVRVVNMDFIRSYANNGSYEIRE